MTGKSVVERVMLGVEPEKYTLGFNRELSEYLADVEKLHRVGGTGTKTDTVRYAPSWQNARIPSRSSIALVVLQLFAVKAYEVA